MNSNPTRPRSVISEDERSPYHLCGMRKTLEPTLPTKTEILADWFWDTAMSLRKTLITIDVEETHFSVRQIWQLQQ